MFLTNFRFLQIFTALLSASFPLRNGWYDLEHIYVTVFQKLFSQYPAKFLVIPSESFQPLVGSPTATYDCLSRSRKRLRCSHRQQFVFHLLTDYDHFRSIRSCVIAFITTSISCRAFSIFFTMYECASLSKRYRFSFTC